VQECLVQARLDDVATRVLEELEPTGCGFGVRRILAAKWASTDLDISVEGGFRTSFFRLFKYISGANDQGAKIAHTIPLIIKWYMMIFGLMTSSPKDGLNWRVGF
jgi:hypothetical protein